MAGNASFGRRFSVSFGLSAPRSGPESELRGRLDAQALSHGLLLASLSLVAGCGFLAAALLTHRADADGIIQFFAAAVWLLSAVIWFVRWRRVVRRR